MTDLEVLRQAVSEATATNSDGHPAVAVQRFRRAVRAIAEVHSPSDDHVALHARALLGLATSSFEVHGDIASSLTLLKRAEELAERAGAGHLIAGVRNNRGLLLMRSGETQAALAAFDQAARLLDVAEPADQGRVLLNRGALHLEHGSLGLAAEDLARSADVFAALGDRLCEFKARHNLGYVEFLAGNLPRALSDMAAAAQIVSEGPRPIALLDHARVLREAGLGRDAAAMLHEAVRLFTRDRLFQDLGEAELVQSECALVDGDWVQSRALAAKALRRFTRRGNVRWQRKAEVMVLRSEVERARRTVRRGHRRAVAALGRRCADLSDACRLEGREDLARAAGLLWVDALLLSGEDTSAAARMVAATRVRRGDPVSVRLQVRALKARVADAAGDRHRARREVRAGLGELADYQSGFGSLDLRTASAVHGVALAELDLALAIRGGRPAEVFASIERTRATSARLAPVRPPADEVTAGLLGELRRVEEGVRALEGGRTAAEELHRLRERAAGLQSALRARSWRRESTTRVAEVAGVGQVRKALEPVGAALVSYAVHDGQWLACLVDGRRVELTVLGPVARMEEIVRRIHADLDAAALPHLPPAVLSAVRASLHAGLAAADSLLLGPLGLSGRPLVLAPSGLLAVLPWSALPSRRGLPLVVTPSATGWVSRARRERVAQRASGSVQVGVVAGPGLTRAATEAQQVAHSWGAARLVLGASATVGAVGQMMAESLDVLHIAAHGVHQTQSPLFSCVRLADGALYAYELDAGSGMAGLVVLSSCEVGLSTIRPGDEALGLTSVLLSLGATSVVAGVARVGDQLAAEVMLGMHQRIAGGADTASALAEAMAASDARMPSPFVCFGSSWAM